jgi:hypothetical protein
MRRPFLRLTGAFDWMRKEKEGQNEIAQCADYLVEKRISTTCWWFDRNAAYWPRIRQQRDENVCIPNKRVLTVCFTNEKKFLKSFLHWLPMSVGTHIGRLSPSTCCSMRSGPTLIDEVTRRKKWRLNKTRQSTTLVVKSSSCAAFKAKLMHS